MLHGALLPQPLRGICAPLSATTSPRRLALPGVKAVITGPTSERRHMGLVVKDETVLAKTRFRYIGEAGGGGGGDRSRRPRGRRRG